MATLSIVTYPHPVLKQKAAEVTVFDEALAQLVADMAETMYAAPGVGLAAPQVGISQQVCVVDISQPEEGEPKELWVLINPVIVETREPISWEEGCLSLPGLYREVPTYNWALIKAADVTGQRRILNGSGLLAVAMLHEIEHLQGRVFIDRLGPLKRRFALKAYRRLSEKPQPAPAATDASAPPAPSSPPESS